MTRVDGADEPNALFVERRRRVRSEVVEYVGAAHVGHEHDVDGGPHEDPDLALAARFGVAEHVLVGVQPRLQRVDLAPVRAVGLDPEILGGEGMVRVPSHVRGGPHAVPAVCR